MARATYRRQSNYLLQMIVDNFNEKFPVGTPVTVKIQLGKPIETTIRAPAEVIGGHSAVGWFDGIDHYMVIEGVERVFKRETNS